MAECVASFPAAIPLDCILAAKTAFQAKNFKAALTASAQSIGQLAAMIPGGTETAGPWKLAASTDLSVFTDDELVAEIEKVAADAPPEGAKAALTGAFAMWLIQLLIQILTRSLGS